jgi:hypothetical protein
VEPPSTDLELELIKRMCSDASRTVKFQCGREYGFTDDDDAPPRATQLHLLSEQELVKMPTHNIDAERELAKFSHLAVVAKFRNKKFSAKGIRTDMTLFSRTSRLSTASQPSSSRSLLSVSHPGQPTSEHRYASDYSASWQPPSTSATTCAASSSSAGRPLLNS